MSTILDHHAAVRPDHDALIWRDGRRSYAELHARVNALAALLADRGIGTGDRVAILAQNRPSFVEAIMAVNRLGAIFLPINVRLAPAGWRFILGHSGAKALLSEEQFEDDLLGVLSDLDVAVRLSIDPPRSPTFEHLECALAAFSGAAVPMVDIPGSPLQRLMYTSGTTARPKGACLSHEDFAWKNLGMMVEFGWNHTEVTLV